MTESYLELKIACGVLQIAATTQKITHRRVAALVGGSLTMVGEVIGKLKKEFNDFKEPKDIEEMRVKYGFDKVDVPKIVKENNFLKEQVESLEMSTIGLEKQAKQLEDSERYYKGMFELLESERGSAIRQISEEKNKQIDALLNELVELHKDYATQYRDFSFNHDDKLLQKEVNIRELKDKLKRCEDTITEYEKKLSYSPDKTIVKKLQEENARLVNQVQQFKSTLVSQLRSA